MEDLFSTLFEEIKDDKSYEDSLDVNFQAIQDFFNAPYKDQSKQKEDIERFILLKNKTLSSYSYQSVESRSFVLILLDLCERFGLHGCIPRIMKIIQKNEIFINKRMKAALRYLYPGPSSNDDLVNKFEEICTLLNEAIAEEEDDYSKSLVTFLNYYAHVVYNTNLFYASELRNKLCNAISSCKYDWLNDISDIAELDIKDPELVFNTIENKIDCITEKNNDVDYVDDECLIEENTDYSDELAHVTSNFMEVRRLSVNHANGQLTGRGVNLLNTENEMFEYIKRYGKMHYAKLLSSFKFKFPQTFTHPINIVDWGCGQGLATMTFIEKYGPSCINNITLIEPSEIVLKRASLHCHKFAPDAKIRTVCKKIDDVKKSDVKVVHNETTIHLFSNILDIDGYNMTRLLSLVDSLLTQRNYFICVSPYIDDIKSARLNKFMRYFEPKPTFDLYHDEENTKSGDFWLCNNTFLKQSFRHGLYNSCRNYNNLGCSNKWTRVLKVFSV
jgi:hypothetical protein